VGALTTVYNFCAQTSCADGANPEGSLIQAANGNLYGTAQFGGANNFGTVFKIVSRGILTTLHSFDSTDGAYPEGRLVQATNGSFYGTTNVGGEKSFGTVFKINTGGTLTTLHSFNLDSTDGKTPISGLVQGTNGTFYGTTYRGSFWNVGTVFNLAVGLGPFVKTIPTSGKVGATVNILGTNLTGTTSVSFNGTAATFAVVSSTEITTAVPAGAKTGKIRVTTPDGTLSSNVAFRVTP
jgi:uncharacterized repeat protein (TIGR03803 family)